MNKLGRIQLANCRGEPGFRSLPCWPPSPSVRASPAAASVHARTEVRAPSIQSGVCYEVRNLNAGEPNLTRRTSLSCAPRVVWPRGQPRGGGADIAPEQRRRRCRTRTASLPLSWPYPPRILIDSKSIGLPVKSASCLQTQAGTAQGDG